MKHVWLFGLGPSKYILALSWSWSSMSNDAPFCVSGWIRKLWTICPSIISLSIVGRPSDVFHVDIVVVFHVVLRYINYFLRSSQSRYFAGPGFESLTTQHDLFMSPGFDSLAQSPVSGQCICGLCHFNQNQTTCIISLLVIMSPHKLNFSMRVEN